MSINNDIITLVLDMNKKGFTLVELLSVITILGLLMTVATISVNNILSNQQQKLITDQIESLGEAASSYVMEERIVISKCSSVDINLEEVVKNSTLLNKYKNNEKCLKSIKIGDIIDKGYFENNNDICNKEAYVYIARLKNGELITYVDRNDCSY